jgi:hypothetical protein
MDLREAYTQIQTQAERLAGTLTDIPQRVSVLHMIYRDSGGNHTFPQVALHGALWAYGFFEITGTLGRMVSYRYCYSREERAFRLGMLQIFADGFKTANRTVFVDTYTNYFFSKWYGKVSGAERFVGGELLHALNNVHDAAKGGHELGKGEKKDIFSRALEWEQERTVAPKVKADIAKFTCPVLTTLVLKPLVRFRYFPRWRYFLFKDFSDTNERIEKALMSYDLAEQMGWNCVVETMAKYRVALPPCDASAQVVS